MTREQGRGFFLVEPTGDGHFEVSIRYTNTEARYLHGQSRSPDRTIIIEAENTESHPVEDMVKCPECTRLRSID